MKYKKGFISILIFMVFFNVHESCISFSKINTIWKIKKIYVCVISNSFKGCQNILFSIFRHPTAATFYSEGSEPSTLTSLKPSSSTLAPDYRIVVRQLPKYQHKRLPFYLSIKISKHTNIDTFFPPNWSHLKWNRCLLTSPALSAVHSGTHGTC